jgi:hypothetical protein
MTERINCNELILGSRGNLKKTRLSTDGDSDLLISKIENDMIYSTIPNGGFFNGVNLTNALYSNIGVQVQLRNNNAYLNSYLPPYTSVSLFTDSVFSRSFDHSGITNVGNFARYLSVNQADDCMTFNDGPNVGNSSITTYIKNNNIWSTIPQVPGFLSTNSVDDYGVKWLLSSTSNNGIHLYSMISNVWVLSSTIVSNSTTGLRLSYLYKNIYIYNLNGNTILNNNGAILTWSINSTFLYLDLYIVISTAIITYIYGYDGINLATYNFQTIGCCFNNDFIFLLDSTGTVNTLRSLKIVGTFLITGSVSISCSSTQLLVGINSLNKGILYDITQITQSGDNINNMIMFSGTDMKLKSTQGKIILDSNVVVKKLNITDLVTNTLICNSSSIFYGPVAINNTLSVSNDLSVLGNSFISGFNASSCGLMKFLGNNAMLINVSNQTALTTLFTGYTLTSSNVGANFASFNASTGTLTVLRSGTYLITYRCSFQANSIGERSSSLYKNGVLYSTIGILANTTQVSVLTEAFSISAPAGTNFNIWAYHTSNVVINVVSASFTLSYLGSL